jgi:ParB-like chromosome segregation protein Spo0J
MPVSDVGNLSSEYGEDDAGEPIKMRDVAGWSSQRMANDRYSPRDLDALVDHVRNHGVPGHITVQDGGVTDGTHRYWAAVQAGLSHIPVERRD